MFFFLPGRNGYKEYSQKWQSRRNPGMSGKQLAAQSVSTTKFADLATTKQELASLKLKVLNVEEERSKILHDLAVKIKEAELRSLQLDIQIKEKQLEKLGQY